jgi:hypothetical protein
MITILKLHKLVLVPDVNPFLRRVLSQETPKHVLRDTTLKLEQFNVKHAQPIVPRVEVMENALNAIQLLA